MAIPVPRVPRVPDGEIILSHPAGRDKLRLYVFAPSKRPRGEGAPSILLFHGGGWNGGHPRRLFARARYLAGRGMLAMSVEYRVAERHGTTPFECVADGRSVMRWVRRHAREFGGAPARVVAGGGSAGGHVAAATATLSGFDEAGDDLSVSPRPDALVLFNPVIDNSPAGYGHERIGARRPDISPLHNIRSGVPPAVVFLGTEDHLIPVATVLEFQRRMQAAGARCDVWT